jgi:hypothetical protein
MLKIKATNETIQLTISDNCQPDGTNNIQLQQQL